MMCQNKAVCINTVNIYSPLMARLLQTMSNFIRETASVLGHFYPLHSTWSHITFRQWSGSLTIPLNGSMPYILICWWLASKSVLLVGLFKEIKGKLGWPLCRQTYPGPQNKHRPWPMEYVHVEWFSNCF